MGGQLLVEGGAVLGPFSPHTHKQNEELAIRKVSYESLSPV